ncbi:hypothetical protein MTP99_005202 [Tenebrio molitor]|nr:hypothetical protein MTP99_005202 [Tenebrio molitor]
MQSAVWWLVVPGASVAVLICFFYVFCVCKVFCKKFAPSLHTVEARQAGQRSRSQKNAPPPEYSVAITCPRLEGHNSLPTYEEATTPKKF